MAGSSACQSLPPESVLQRFNGHLYTAIHSPETLAQFMYAEGFIACDVLDNLPSLSFNERKMKLLSAFRISLSTSTQKMQVMTKVYRCLEATGQPLLMDLASQMRALCPGEDLNDDVFPVQMMQGKLYDAGISGLESEDDVQSRKRRQILTVTPECNSFPPRKRFADANGISLNDMKPNGSARHLSNEGIEVLQVEANTPHPASQTRATSLPAKVQVYQEYLKSLYEKDTLPAYHKFPHHLKVDCYIKLALVTTSLRKRNTAQDLRLKLHGKIDELALKRKRVQLNVRDVGYKYKGVNRTLARRILVEGSPGIGKTTFAWELCRQWQSGNMLKEYDMVVLLRCREKDVQHAKSLYDLLHHSKHDVRKAVFDYICDKNGDGLLLLVEGYDELPQEFLHDSFIHHLLTDVELPSMTIMVTSRPITHRNLPIQFLHSLHQHIEILGFTESDIKDYIASACPDQSVLLDFQNYLALHPFIMSVMCVPLQCAVITDLYVEHWEAGERAFAPNTFTGLYTELIKTHMLRYMSSHPEYKNLVAGIHGLKDLPPKLYEGLKQLAKLAAEGIKKQEYFFGEEGFAEHFGLMQRVESLNPSSANSVEYCFHHLTLQEFLAALHWSHLSPEELTTLLTTSQIFPLRNLVTEGIQEKHDSTVHHWPVLMFLAGLTQLKGIPTKSIADSFSTHEVHPLLSLRHDFSASLCQVLFETQSSDLVSSLFTSQTFSPQCVMTLDWYILGYCITFSSSTATWQVYYDHAMGHKPEHIEMLVKGLSSFHRSDQQSGYITELYLKGGPDLPKCLQILPALVPYTSNVTALNIIGKLPSGECKEFMDVLHRHYSHIMYFGLLTWNTAADCFGLVSTLSNLPQLEVLVLGFSDAGSVQIPPQNMKKLRHITFLVSYTLSLHESLIVPNHSSLRQIALVKCNMTLDCSEALAAFFRSPNNNINTFDAICCSFRDNLSTMSAALASTRNLETLIFLECNIGFEGAQLVAEVLQKRNTIVEVGVVDETITSKGAQLLFKLLSSRDCQLVLHDSFENCLGFTGEEQLELSFDKYALSLEKIKEISQEILSYI